MIRFLTAGESHGKSLSAIVEGVPSNIVVPPDYIDFHLSRRQMGYGRSHRMKIENDKAEILSGIRHGKTLGSPISLLVRNNDWEHWKEVMSVEIPAVKSEKKRITVPRPGHADLTGVIKYNFDDIRNSIERSSARETAVRVAVASFSRLILEILGINIGSYVENIGASDSVSELSPDPYTLKLLKNKTGKDFDAAQIREKADKSPLRILDNKRETAIIDSINSAMENGDTLGGTFVVIVSGLPPGFGSFMSWDRKLDGQIAAAIMSINAVKGVEIGGGFYLSGKPGSAVMDEIIIAKEEFVRKTNFAGGIEGGISNGMPLIVRGAMKPIPTLMKPLQSVHLSGFKQVSAFRERSDYTAVPACSVIAEAMTAFVVANAVLEKTGGDSIEEIIANFNAYKNNIFKRITKKFAK